MGRRRGFFAEMQHQARLAEQRQRREQAAAVRAHNQAVREAERAQREYRRAQERLTKTKAAERVAAAKEAERLHREQMTAEAEAATARLISVYAEIDGILAATLDVDDYVDVEALKIAVTHPPFDPGALGQPTPAPAWVQPSPEPVFTPPPAPTGMGKLFSKKKHEQQKADAHQQWQQEHARWLHLAQTEVPAQNEKLRLEHERTEADRLRRLDVARTDYDRECSQREADAAEHNRAVDEFAARLGSDEASAIDEYVGIVLANSAYPDAFPVEHDYAFDADLKELQLTVTVPAPDSVPATKHVKYIATADELRETPLSQKDQRERYNNAVYAVALRTLHEVFEADRAKRIESISMTVNTSTIDPATGHPVDVPFVAAAVERKQFLHLNLAEVEPPAALEGLRALTSKNAFALKPIATQGVRR